uniref:Uncharacterized protein n=1 Tax=Cucumis melo TaxID=3656 RepID=A0A9I9D4N6_CUCME
MRSLSGKEKGLGQEDLMCDKGKNDKTLKPKKNQTCKRVKTRMDIERG